MSDDPVQYWKDVLCHYGETYSTELIRLIAEDTNTTEDQVIKGIEMVQNSTNMKEVKI